MGSSALTKAVVIGTLLQVVMVVAGHFVPAIAALFAILGMAISLFAGLLYARWAAPLTAGAAGGGGAVAGGICALIGIAISFLLEDVTATVLVFGTLSSAVTGMIGGLIGRVLGGRRAAV